MLNVYMYLGIKLGVNIYIDPLGTTDFAHEIIFLKMYFVVVLYINVFFVSFMSSGCL